MSSPLKTRVLARVLLLPLHKLSWKPTLWLLASATTTLPLSLSLCFMHTRAREAGFYRRQSSDGSVARDKEVLSLRRNCSSKGSVVMAVEGRGGGKKRAGRSRREQQQKVGNSGQLRMWADAVPHESHPGRPIRPTPSHGPTRG
ncbi:Homeobox protein knotted-1-like [Musa troglodytarum]|uniref:Homeobox protein knotted-1-like n=1 Tax=Musa troglodytarum TaxID=320322 RepID=A0A9E7KSS6_9LILI|nr:Homeobox protein knotted-1-like [Musa troglodytarum]URE28131.1 Homeobox protein knotted-1-like [Musa troglodytarum]URE28133.1 Homeobox protein knotted-1-like [Musa troglodytarum]